MPLQGEAKRLYQREYMRRKHGFQPRGVGKRGESERGNLDPYTNGTLDPEFRPKTPFRRYIQGLKWELMGREFRPTAMPPYPFNAKVAMWYSEYQGYIRARGYEVRYRPGGGADLVSLATGEPLGGPVALDRAEVDARLHRWGQAIPW